MAKSKDSLSRVKRSRNEKTGSLPDRLLTLTKNMAVSGVKLFAHVLLGILCIQHCRLSQSGILPTCISTKPYTSRKIEMEQIHMDFLMTTDKGKDKSIKATYPLKENLAIFQDSSLLHTIQEWTRGVRTTNITYYFGSCMAAATVSFYSLHSNLYGFVNSWFPQWLIMFMSFTIIPIILQLTVIWTVIVFVTSSLVNWQMLLELSTIDKSKLKRRTFRPDPGMWTWPSSPYTVLILLIVI